MGRITLSRTVVLLLGATIVTVIVAIAAIAVTLKPTTSYSDSTYSVVAPGPHCDGHGGNWFLATDAQATVTCSTQQMRLDAGATDGRYAEVFYTIPGGGRFAARYRVTVDARIASGSPTASVGIEVHRQSPRGGQILEIARDGMWDITGFTNAGKAQRLAIGMVATMPTNPQITAEVNGSTIMLALNGTLLATVVDPTYLTTSSIALVARDVGQPTTALFDHFTYQPLGAATGAGAPPGYPAAGSTPGNSMSTAAASGGTGPSAGTTAYSAPIPGPGCDHGGAFWPAPDRVGASTQFSCSASGLRMSQSPNANAMSTVRFYGQVGDFPTNYTVAATIDVSQLNGGCAGFFTRVQDNGGRYGFFLCGQTGEWYIARFAAGSGAPTTLQSGQVPLASSYQVAAIMRDQTLTLRINGRDIGQATDATFTTTSYLDLAMFAGSAGVGTATFSDFIYTPSVGT